jgi:hypothetical protein
MRKITSRLMIKANLCLLIFLFSWNILAAQTDCNCNQKLVVQVNAKCKYVLTKALLGLKNCPDSYIAVLDNKPQNRDTIDAPGSYTYGLYQNDGRLICLGNVIAAAPVGPVLDSVNYIKDTLSFRNWLNINGSLLSTGVPGSNLSLGEFPTRLTFDGRFTQLKADNVPNLGIPYFSMGCQTPSCGISLSFFDNINGVLCPEVRKGSDLYVTIQRSWIARDCQQRISSSTQYLYIKRPDKADIHWSLPQLQGKNLTLYYNGCTSNPKEIPIDLIYPAVGIENIPIPGINQFSQAIQEKIDTVCKGNGISITRRFLIYDECRDVIVDTLQITLQPNSNKREAIVSSKQRYELIVNASTCTRTIPGKLEQLKALFQLQINPLCKIKQFAWEIESYDINSKRFVKLSRYNLDSLILKVGDYRINFTLVDSCQNLYTKSLDLGIRVAAQVKLTCPIPFDVKISGTFNGVKSERVLGVNGFFQGDPCAVYYSGVRRIVEASCLANFNKPYSDYDIDKDGNALEHFELIKSGPFAKMYFTPKQFFIDIFECDEGKAVYYESSVNGLGGNRDSCISYVNVLAPKTGILDVGLAYGKATVGLGKSVCVPVKANGFKNIIGLQFETSYDQKILKLDSVRFAANNPIKPLFGPFSKTPLILTWVYNGKNPATLPNQSTIFELCFTTIGIGTSPVWVDTTRLIEIIDVDERPLKLRTQVGEVIVLAKNDFNTPIKQINETAPLSTNEDKKIRVFPNPGSEKINVALPNSFLPQGKFLLKDLQGRVLKEQMVNGFLNQIYVDDIPSGLVFLELHSQNQVWIERVVVLH